MNHLTLSEMREVGRLIEALNSSGFTHISPEIQLYDLNGESLGTITKRYGQYALVYPEPEA